jgi:acetyl esterase/lipase
MRNVLILDGKLAGFPASKPLGFTGPVIDAGGRWVMPALSDMHTHSVGNFMPPGGFQTARADVVRMLQEHSAVTHVTTDDPPTILIHGDQDKAVPVQQSRQLMERLNETNVPARLVVREGVGHAYPGWEADAALIADWFDTHIRRIH